MKKYLLLFLLIASPCLAGMGIGGFPYPGPGITAQDTSVGAEFCDGSEVFCTSWETGTDALNTGATGNEDVFSGSAGTPSRVSTTSLDGDYGVELNASVENVSANNGGSGFGNIAWQTGQFKVIAESINTGINIKIGTLYNSTSYTLVSIRIKEDASNYDSVMTANLIAQTTSSTPSDVGTAQVINLGSVYYYKIKWSSGTNVRWKLYNSAKELVYDTGDVAITRTGAVSSIFCTVDGGNATVQYGAVKITTTEPTL